MSMYAGTAAVVYFDTIIFLHFPMLSFILLSVHQQDTASKILYLYFRMSSAYFFIRIPAGMYSLMSWIKIMKTGTFIRRIFSACVHGPPGWILWRSQRILHIFAACRRLHDFIIRWLARQHPWCCLVESRTVF